MTKYLTSSRFTDRDEDVENEQNHLKMDYSETKNPDDLKIKTKKSADDHVDGDMEVPAAPKSRPTTFENFDKLTLYVHRNLSYF